jgi:hypothetical protein
MKNGLWIGGLILALCAGGSVALAEEGTWRAVDGPPDTTATGVTLGAPIALPNETTRVWPVLTPVQAMPTLSSGIRPISYEEPVAKTTVARPTPAPSVIAISTPIAVATSQTNAGDEEDTESLFAIDRPTRPTASPLSPKNRIALASNLYGQWNTPPAPLPVIEGADPEVVPSIDPLRQRFYVSGEYLLWWIKGDRLPILATTSTPADFGVLGAPSTTVLFGGNSVGSGPFSGARLTAGYWLDECGDDAIEIGGFFLGPRSSNFSVSSVTNPVIGRPFLEVNNNQETAQLTALPGVATGTLTIHAPSNFWGLESNFRCMVCSGCSYRITALAGFRNLNLDESIRITENIQGLATSPPPFTDQTITVFDRFGTQNHFYGGQIGADARWYWGRWSVDTRVKVALGATTQQLDIDGGQTFVSPTGVARNFQGGLLALPSNIGHFTHTAFSVVPEVGLNVGYQITPKLRGFVAYNFLFWSNVIRPGPQIDRGLDVTQIPNFSLNPEPAPVSGRHPAPTFHESDFWAQGISFGLEFTY